MKAIVVDDVPLMRKVITAKLEKAGITKVLDTGDPKRAISDFSNEMDVRLVIADYKMPSMNGSEFFSKIFEYKDKINNVKTVLMSGIENLYNIERTDGLAIDYYLSKTDLIDQLDDIVREIEKSVEEEQKSETISMEEFKTLFREQKQISIDKDNLVVVAGNKKVFIPIPNKLNFVSDERES